MTNPWNLTPRQCEAMAALVEHGSDKAVAGVMNVSHNVMSETLRRCCKRIGVRTLVQAALQWDRWARKA